MMFLIFSLIALQQPVQAEALKQCLLTIDRAACPGKETEAFAPYNGANPTYDGRVNLTETACKAFAAQTAKIVRKRIIKKISVTAVSGETQLPLAVQEWPCAQ